MLQDSILEPCHALLLVAAGLIRLKILHSCTNECGVHSLYGVFKRGV